MRRVRDGGESRRGFLKCMTWAGTGLVWTLAGGVPASVGLEAAAADARGPRRSASCRSATATSASPSRVNPDARATFREAVAKIAAMPQQARLHHPHRRHHPALEGRPSSTTPTRSSRRPALPVFHVPGEHDVLDEGSGKAFLDRYGKGATGRRLVLRSTTPACTSWPWSTCVNLKAGGMGSLGADAARLAEGRPRRARRLDADRGLRPHPALGALSGLGLGHRRERRRRWRC